MNLRISSSAGKIRTVTGDIREPAPGIVYTHEHLIIDSPLIEASFPHIHLHDVDAATAELTASREVGAALFVDTMPMSAGRDAVRLAEISRRSGVSVLAATGLHHDRYYGPLHWSNRVTIEELSALFIADLIEGIDEFDYTGPIVRRTDHRAGLLKVATHGPDPDQRDARNLAAVAAASLATGAPVLTHCEGGWGGQAQIAALTSAGVHASSIILSHLDKADDLQYLIDLAQSGVNLELDQVLRQCERGTDSVTVRAVLKLVESGFGDQIMLGTDGARRSLWASLGGKPGLAWLAGSFPAVLREAGLNEAQLRAVLRDNAVNALRWREAESG